METRRLGRIEEDWPAYRERVEQYFIVNGLSMEVAEGEGAEAAEEKKKTAVFLTVIGAHTYQTVHSLVSPNKPSEPMLQQ